MRITAQVDSEFEIDILISDVIDGINGVRIVQRWNYLAELLEGIQVEEIESLSDEQKGIIRNYLKKAYKRF